MGKNKAICCFCVKEVPWEAIMIVKIINPAEAAIVKEQLFYAHALCLREHFDKQVLLPVLPRE